MSIGWIVLIVIAAIAVVKVAYYFGIDYALSEPPRAHEIHTITTDDGWRIKLLRYRAGDDPGEPVFLCHGFSANHLNLTMPAGHALADFLAERDYDCWAIDLRGNRLSEPPAGVSRHKATFDGYVMHDIPAALDFIRYATGYEQVHWVGHSMGGMLLYAYELVHGRDRIASGTTLGAPPGFDPAYMNSHTTILGLINRFPRLAELYERSLMPIVATLRPNLSLFPINWKNVHPGVTVKDFYNIVEMPAGPVAHTLMDCAAHRFWAVNNDTVNVLAGLKTLRTPVLAFAAQRDPMATPALVQTFVESLPTNDKKCVILSKANGCSEDYDHVEMPFSRNGREEVFEPIADWIAAHPAKRGQKPAPKREPQPEPVPEARQAVVKSPAAASTAVPAARTAPAPETPQKPAPRPSAPQPASGTTLWGKALEDAASILTGLDDGDAPSADATAGGETRKAAAKRPAAKVAQTRQTPPKTATRKTTKKKAAVTKSAKPKSAKKKTNAKKKTSSKSKSATKSKPAARKKSPTKTKATSKRKTKNKSAASTKQKAAKKSVKKESPKTSTNSRNKAAKRKTARKSRSTKKKKKS